VLTSVAPCWSVRLGSVEEMVEGREIVIRLRGLWKRSGFFGDLARHCVRHGPRAPIQLDRPCHPPQVLGAPYVHVRLTEDTSDQLRILAKFPRNSALSILGSAGEPEAVCDIPQLVLLVRVLGSNGVECLSAQV